ncbi:U-megalopygitoxin(8)-Mo12-like [Anticarsia gemmatalis]|uniref:U-megalopygitoxin(8)-Mo12-like n=1 Tax=Anticarsia gemmatalis TaxID=129554 RepID=UPI003F758AFE
MDLKLFIILICLKVITARISIEVEVDNNNNVTLTYSGVEVNVVTEEDINLFDITNENLFEALTNHYGKRPRNIYLKSPTPWGDLYKSYKWEQVSRVLSIKSVRVKGISKQPIVVLSQDFENLSDQPIKVNTGISHSIQNTLTTSWSKEKEITVSQEISYDVNLLFAKASGTTGFSYTTNWGTSEEKSETVTIGANTGMETELKPGQAVTAVLSASAGYLEIEVIHQASLRGNVAVNFKKSFRGHHFWGPSIEKVMNSGGLSNEITTLETIRFGFHVDATLRVYDKETGLPV